MNPDDLPPEPANDEIDDTSFAGGLGVSFAGLFWITLFAAVGGLMLWGLMHWLS